MLLLLLLLAQWQFELVLFSGAEARPAVYLSFDRSPRYVVLCNPWKAMRVLGSFGYTLTVTPLGGRVETGEGEKRTCVWTLVRSRAVEKKVVVEQEKKEEEDKTEDK